MIKRLVTITAATALLLATTAPSFAATYYRGGSSWHWHAGYWNGGVWHGGGWWWGPAAVGAAVGLGVGAAIASAPHYYGYPYHSYPYSYPYPYYSYPYQAPAPAPYGPPTQLYPPQPGYYGGGY